MTLPDEFRSGQGLSARDLNQIRDELARLARVSAAAPLHVSSDGSGLRFNLTEPEVFAIKIGAGGAGGAYPWTRQNPGPMGTWVDDVQTGTMAADPAYETNMNASVPAGTIILRAYRDPITADLRFERGSC